MSDRRTAQTDRRAVPVASSASPHPVSPYDRRASDQWHGDYRYDYRSGVASPDSDRRKRG
jgi:hypothetical protein